MRSRVITKLDTAGDFLALNRNFEDYDDRFTRFRLEPKVSPPKDPVLGEVYFNSLEMKAKCFDGTVWRDLW